MDERLQALEKERDDARAHLQETTQELEKAMGKMRRQRQSLGDFAPLLKDPKVISLHPSLPPLKSRSDTTVCNVSTQLTEEEKQEELDAQTAIAGIESQRAESLAKRLNDFAASHAQQVEELRAQVDALTAERDDLRTKVEAQRASKEALEKTSAQGTSVLQAELSA
jgi:uncharacterized coiled-coil DUF342 family protein